MKYIHFDKRYNVYVLTKRVMNKNYNFGSYISLNDAKKARDYFEKKGWGKCLDERLKFSYKKPQYIIWLESRKVYQIRKRINGKLKIFGQFKTLEEAKREVEIFKKYNWDWETVCDLNE